MYNILIRVEKREREGKKERINVTTTIVIATASLTRLKYIVIF
jgi:hypothetical protein